MPKMIANQASLAIRFPVSNGWTRKSVAELLETPDVEAVIPSYFDYEKQNEIIEIKERFLMPSSLNDNSYSDCEYFIVLSEIHPFNKEKFDNLVEMNYPAMS